MLFEFADGFDLELRHLFLDFLRNGESGVFRPNFRQGLAAEIGVALLTEAQYRQLQELGEFDLKTSSWLHTPDDVRSLGGSLFGDRRYGRVFVYHNGAQSYYAARGFRASLRV